MAKTNRMPTLMSAITQPASTGITAQACQRQRHGHQRCEQEHALVGARWDHRFLEHELQKVGKGLEQTPRPDHVRPAAQLHGGPDLAVGIEDVGDEQISSATSTSSDCARMIAPGQT
jgi:hypothetical protein